MKATELRIGNWCKIAKSPFKEEVGEYPIEAITIHYFESGEDLILEPIPLTEEWLLKFGFEKVKDDPSYCDDGEFTINHKRFTVFKKELITHNSIHGWFINGIQFDLNLKYVHQLQNLYFTLTGEELKTI